MSKKFVIVKGADSLSIVANYNATMLMNILVRSHFCTKKVIEEYRLSAEAFEWIMGEIETRFHQAMVSKRPNLNLLIMLTSNKKYEAVLTRKHLT